MDDAEDADVIVHEYGHALSDQAAPKLTTDWSAVHWMKDMEIILPRVIRECSVIIAGILFSVGTDTMNSGREEMPTPINIIPKIIPQIIIPPAKYGVEH